ncbi:MAG: hypothetical protein J6A59_13870, partial [Lachnospiraceae bacterium]|nr:hypothetical protein [Lachnospiraceae bacterium]
MKIRVLKQLQEYYYSLKDDNGNWRERPIGILAKTRTPSKNIDKLKVIINVLESSDKISEISKIFICNRKLSIRSATDIFNDFREQASVKLDKPLRPIGYATGVNKIQKDENDIIKCLGEDFLRNLAYDIDLTTLEIENKINDLFRDFCVFDKQRKNLTVYINDSIVKCNEYKGSEEFFDILSSLECYLIQQKTIVEDTINKNQKFVEYFNYLLATKDISDKDVASDRERLLMFLNNQDYKQKISVVSNDNLIIDDIVQSENDIDTDLEVEETLDNVDSIEESEDTTDIIEEDTGELEDIDIVENDSEQYVENEQYSDKDYTDRVKEDNTITTEDNTESNIEYDSDITVEDIDTEDMDIGEEDEYTDRDKDIDSIGIVEQPSSDIDSANTGGESTLDRLRRRLESGEID